MRRGIVARIDEPRCIGCTRCIEVCPVDAISGASGLMHAVIAQWCIGCKLCLPPCPVDCIDMVAPRGSWGDELRRAAGRRGRQRIARMEAKKFAPVQDRKAVLAAALARKRR